MRELAYFIASVAAAAVMTALALILRPESPLSKVLLWGGIGLFTACAYVVALDYLKPDGNRYFLIGSALGIALLVGFGTAYLFESPLPSDENKNQSSKTGEIADFNLLLECSANFQTSFPAVVPPEGSIKIFTAITMQQGGAVGGGGREGTSGEKWEWPPNFVKNLSLAKCRLTNYGQATIFNVELRGTAYFDRIERTGPGSFTAKDRVNEVRYIIPITKLESGKENGSTFYLHNQSMYVAQFIFDPIAYYVAAGEPKQVRLVQPNDLTRMLSLWPNRDSAEIVDEQQKAKQ
jgi:hypothetical protein